jgi:hypothetical protein
VSFGEENEIMKMQYRILLVICDLLGIALVLMQFMRPDPTRSPGPYDQSLQIGMSFDDAKEKLGNPQFETAFWKKADGDLSVFCSGDRKINYVHFSSEKMSLAGLSKQQWWVIGITLLGFLFGLVVLPPGIKGWRSIVLTVSVPTLYGLGAAALSAIACAWFH